MEIKGHLNITCRKNPAMTKGRWPTCGVMCSGPSGASLPENGGSKVIKTAPKELKEKYQQVFA